MLSCLIPKINRNIILESCYIKIEFKVKDNDAKDFLTKNNDLLNVMFRETPCTLVIFMPRMNQSIFVPLNLIIDLFVINTGVLRKTIA